MYKIDKKDDKNEYINGLRTFVVAISLEKKKVFDT